ncbi:MAG: asparagine synthase (glutamine-hydrolyzing) [Eubacterium sp.]
MCGIAGFYQTEQNYLSARYCGTSPENPWRKRLTAMRCSLRNRGPNDENTLLFPHAGLAHTRLAIRDILGGKQPMSAQFNGTGASIVYNGEIYNTPELREELKSFSLSWSTTSDTEVILNGFLAMGTSFFKKLNGIYAFAIYVHQTKELFLVRDPLGVKPLFYTFDKDTVVFASEPKALFAYGIRPTADISSWNEIFTLGPARTLGNGGFADVHELLPGEYMHFYKHQYRHHHFHKLEAAPHETTYEDTVRHVRFLLCDSIHRQMVSDIPICSFLSGGLDSSLVTAICQRFLKKEDTLLDTFSFDFKGNDTNFQANSFQSSQDRPFAELAAKHLDTHHTFLECNNETQADYLYKAVEARDFPCMADVESSMLYFCEQVSKTHRVALTGECADEIFGGYPWFHKESLWQKNTFPWSYDLEARKALLRDDFSTSLQMEEYAKEAYEKTIACTPRLPEDSEKEARRREISWLNIRWFMMTLLNRMDRTSMYSGLEARVPFADHRILQYVYNIPWTMKCHNGQPKSLLIDAGKGLLPPAILNRKKSPYPKTYDPAYEKLLAERLYEMVHQVNSPLTGIVDPKKLDHFLITPSDYGKPWYGQLMAGPQMLAYLLQVGYWIQTYSISL